MSEFKIEKDIPLPRSKTDPLRISTPLKALAQAEVGDSIFLADCNSDSVRGRASQISSELGIKFVTRKMAGGIRVWRVA